MTPPKRLSDVVATENAGSIAASLRKYGYHGPERPSDVARWLEAQGEDVNTPVAEAKKTGHERRPRQDAFRQALLLAYEGRCAITGCDAEPALEAAHVADWRSENDAGAGILLRADLHKLFDAGLLVIGRGYTVVAVSTVVSRAGRHEPPSPEKPPPLAAFAWRGHWKFRLRRVLS